jgi:hypothetical protein
MEPFGVLLLAADEYPNPPGPLPSSESADGLAELVVGERGGVLVGRVVVRSREELIAALEGWAERKAKGNVDRPASTIVYFAGHGSDNGLSHTLLIPEDGVTRSLETEALGAVFRKDWIWRKSNGQGWTLFVLDCCGSDVGRSNLANKLTKHAIEAPRRFSIWPTAPSGASRSGYFVESLARAIASFTENDASIPLNELFDRLDLGQIEPYGRLPREAALDNLRHTADTVVMPLDAASSRVCRPRSAGISSRRRKAPSRATSIGSSRAASAKFASSATGYTKLGTGYAS